MSASVCMDLKVNSRKYFLPQNRATPLALPAGIDLRDEAIELLGRWPDLSPLIQEASGKLRESFGPSVKIALERFDDLEAGTEDPSLYLIVGTTLKAREAREALDRFEDDWWMDNAERSNNRLHISVEFL